MYSARDAVRSFSCLPQARVLSFSCHVSAALFVCICFTGLGFDRDRRQPRRASRPDFFFRSSISSLHGMSISIDRRFMATEGRRRRRWCAVRPMFDTGVLAFRRRQERHRYLENPAVIIGRTSRAIRVIWRFYKLPLNDFRYYCPHPADSDHPTVLQYLSASFGTSALKLPFSCYFIFPHRYGL